MERPNTGWHEKINKIRDVRTKRKLENEGR
jgi:hypothetical protein